jgi:hypothetical protein
MQGYYLGQGMTSEELLGWLRQSPWDPDLQPDRDQLQPA